MAEKISKAPITVRAATARDAIAVRALIDLYVPSGVLLPRSEDFVATYAHNFVVAEAPGEGIVGCAYLDEYSPSIAELRSLAVAPDWQGAGVGRALVDGIEALARTREYATLFAVSNDEAYFKRYGFERREIPELDRERSEVSRYKGVYAKEL
jgi:amino-acid N-acetyltransferase